MLYMSCITVIRMLCFVITRGISSTLMCMGPSVFRSPDFFYVLFACSEDLLNQGIKADAKERSAYCRCGREGCPKCAFILHTCKFRTPVSIMDIGRAETCSAGGGGGGGTGALRRWGGGGKMGFRAGTLCYVVLAALVQILPATKSVVGWHDTPADG